MKIHFAKVFPPPIQCCFTSTETAYGLLGTGIPGRPPQSPFFDTDPELCHFDLIQLSVWYLRRIFRKAAHPSPYHHRVQANQRHCMLPVADTHQRPPLPISPSPLPHPTQPTPTSTVGVCESVMHTLRKAFPLRTTRAAT